MIYEFTPTQSYNGYDEPWASGAGPNIFNEEWEAGYYYDVTDGGKKSGVNWKCSDYIPCEPETTYYCYVYTNRAGSLGYVCFYDEDKTFISYHTTVADNISFSTPATAKYLTIYASWTLTDLKMSINYPSTLTTYYPYFNICPLIGYNIWDPSQDQMIPVYSGYVDANANKLYLHPVYEEYDGEELVGPWMSSMDKYTEEGTPTTGAFVVDFGGEVAEYDITDFMLQTLLDSLGVRRFITSGAMLLNSLMDQAQGRVRSEDELLNRSLPLHVIAIGEDLPTSLVIKKPVSDVLPGLPGKTKI